MMMRIEPDYGPRPYTNEPTNMGAKYSPVKYFDIEPFSWGALDITHSK